MCCLCCAARAGQDHVIYERSLAVEGGHPQRQQQSLRGGAEHWSWSPVPRPPHRHGGVGHRINVNHVANWLAVNGLSVCTHVCLCPCSFGFPVEILPQIKICSVGISVSNIQTEIPF